MRTLVGGLVLLTAAGVAAAKPTPTQKCRAAKIRATVKKVQAVGACRQQAALGSGQVSMGCLAAAEKKLVAAFAAADKKGGCDGDESTLSTDADDCVDTIITAVPAPTTTTTLAGGVGCLRRSGVRDLQLQRPRVPAHDRLRLRAGRQRPGAEAVLS